MAECHDDGNHLLTSSQLSSLIVSHRVSSCLIVADTARGTLSGKQLNATQHGRRETNAMEKINYACANTWVYNSTIFYLGWANVCTKKQRPYGYFFGTKCIFVKVTGVPPQDESDLLCPECAHWSDHWSFRQGFANNAHCRNGSERFW